MNIEDFENLPDEMINARRWLVWKEIPGTDASKKPKKIPFYINGSIRNGILETEEDLKNLGTFKAALRALSTNKYTGLGFALGEDKDTGNYFQGIDIDKISLHPELGPIVDDLPGYVERSPSGDGYHAIGYGKKFDAMASNKSGIEAYSFGRFFTVTGEAVFGYRLADLSGIVENKLRPIHTLSSAHASHELIDYEKVSIEDVRLLRSALNCFKADDRDRWIRYGQALCKLGAVGRSLWMDWSQQSDKHDPVGDAKTWDSFSGDHTAYPAIFKDAYAQGWDGNKKDHVNDFFANNAVIDDKPLYDTDIKPYHGAMEAVVKQVLSIANKPQPELTILSALIGMSSAIGGNYRLPGGGRLNLYGIGISSTGTGKDKAMLAGVSLALMAGAETIGMPGSGAALEDSLSDYNTKLLLNIDEVAHFIAAMNDNKQTHMASLSGNLLKLFTASRGSYITRKLANSSNNEQKTCVNPCVSLLGFACPEKLGAAFGSSGNIDDGLIGRMIVVNGRSDIKPRRDNKELHFSHEISALAKKINCSHEIVLSFSKEADARLDELINEFDESSNKSTNPFAKNLKVRSFEKCERISGVLAVWDCPENPIIELSHVEWAEGFVKHSDNAVLSFTSNHMHGGIVQSNAARVLKDIDKFKNGELMPATKTQEEILKSSGIYPRTAILKSTHLAKKDFDDAIDHLIALGDINTGIKNVNGANVNVIFR